MIPYKYFLFFSKNNNDPTKIAIAVCLRKIGKKPKKIIDLLLLLIIKKEIIKPIQKKAYHVLALAERYDAVRYRDLKIKEKKIEFSL